MGVSLSRANKDPAKPAIKHPRNEPRCIQKVATDLQAVIAVEVIDLAMRNQWPIGDRAATKTSGEASFEILTWRQ